MRTVAVIAFMFLTLRTEASSLDLTNWVGRYPVSNDKRFQSIFREPMIEKALAKLLTRSERKLLTQMYAVVTPIRLIHTPSLSRIPLKGDAIDAQHLQR